MNNAIDQNEVYDDSTNLSFLDYIQIMPQTVSLHTAKKNVKLQEQLMSINL